MTKYLVAKNQQTISDRDDVILKNKRDREMLIRWSKNVNNIDKESKFIEEMVYN